MSVIRDTATVYMRELRPTLREPLGLAFNLVQPLIFLLLFGPLLGGMPGVGDTSHWQWFVPGIFVMIAVFSMSVAGYSIITEMQTGAHERLLVTPLNRSALLIGRSMKEIVPLLAQTILIMLVVLPMGFRLYPLGALTGLIVLAAFGVGLGALSHALAIAVNGQDWLFWIIQQTLPFPLLILSGMMLPLEMGTDWMQAVSRINPLTYIVEAERALFAGDFAHPAVLPGALVAVLVTAVGLAVGIRAMRRA